MEINDKEKLLIPKELFKKLEQAKQNNANDLVLSGIINEILKNQMFQMLNPDYPIPYEYCLHLRQIVYPDKTSSSTTILYKSYQCINCKKYL